MTLLQGFFALAAVFLMLLAVCWGIIVLERKFPGKNYDERQQIARGRAYRASFWFGFLYYLAVSVYAVNQGGEMNYLLLFGGMTMQAVVFHIYCMLTGAALPLSEKPWVPVICYSIMSMMYLIPVFTGAYTDTLTMSKEGTRTGVNLVLGVFFLALAVLHLMNRLRKERE